MSKYYTAKRGKYLYTPKAKEPFKVSRSKMELFVECPKCFYLDRRLGIARPPGFPFSLNSAVDALLKKEFDILRAAGEPHPLMKKYGIDAVPARHDKLNEWRDTFKGVQYLHAPTNLLLTGAIDDLWQAPSGEYIVVDYKSTSKNAAIDSLDEDWHGSYKRQLEVYQWLIRKNGYEVGKRGYFVYCNGRTDTEKFDGRLEFVITIIAHDGKDDWVEGLVWDIHRCLNSDAIPEAADDCDYCAYREAVAGEARHI